MTVRTGRLVRGCLLASPLLFLGAAGCGSTRLTSLDGSFNGTAAQLARSQKEPDVIPASAVALPPTTLADGTVAVRAVAYVNHAPVYESEWRDAVAARAREFATLAEPELSQKRKQVEQQELERLIEREVIVEVFMTQFRKLRPKAIEDLQREAGREFEKQMRRIKEASGAQTEEQLKEMMAAQGTSMDALRRQTERAFIQMEFMRNMIFPKIQAIPLSDIREYYDRHPDEFKDHDRAKWQGIFLDAAKFESRDAAARYAEGVAARLRAGDDFSTTATQLRQSGLNIQLSDAGVGEKAGEIRPAEAEPVLFRMKPGEVGPVVEMPGGFLIVKVTERSYAGRKPLTVEVQNDIRKTVQNLYVAREWKRLVEEMKPKVVIQKVVQ